ncbi:hypothetical protein [uncultured Sulfitobacter sp.]|uniref:hypothetical protein n=1 Tax=uncultured Sulfitobacter sp. TaxID=191468 RepID=UPI002606D230|nr:hypothetical protein [uncultured Sulfitobacter sp.]
MSGRVYVPAKQVRGWLRSLCGQNLTELTGIMQLMRIELQRRKNRAITNTSHHECIDQSETDSDRQNAENFYHRAFWQLSRDWFMHSKAKGPYFNGPDGVVIGDIGMLDPAPDKGDDWTGETCSHAFAHMNEDNLTFTMSQDPASEGRGIPAVGARRRRLLGAKWLWQRDDLPALVDMLKYAHLPPSYTPDPKILGLDADLTAEGAAIMAKAHAEGLTGKNLAMAEFYARKYPNGRPKDLKKMSVPAFVEEFRQHCPRYDSGVESSVRRQLNDVWKTVKPA